MNKISEIGNSWGQQIINNLRSNYENKGLKASGDFGNSLEVKVNESESNLKIQILGNKQIDMMTYGRKANQKQDAKSLKRFVGWAGSTVLADWVKNKGLSINPFAVAWKIAREGVKVPNSINDGKLLEQTFTKESISDLQTKIGNSMIIDFKSLYLKSWK